MHFLSWQKQQQKTEKHTHTHTQTVNKCFDVYFETYSQNDSICHVDVFIPLPVLVTIVPSETMMNQTCTKWGEFLQHNGGNVDRLYTQVL